MGPKTPTIPFRNSEDYLTARAANPVTGLISPSQYSPGLGPLTPRTPATPGEALTLSPSPQDEDASAGASEALSIEQHNALLGQSKRPGLRRLVAAIGERGRSDNTSLQEMRAQHAGHESGKVMSCSSDDELFFANPPQAYHQSGLQEAAALSRMKTVWRDVSAAWQERRAMASATTGHTSLQGTRAIDASTQLAQLECVGQDSHTFSVPKKPTGPRIQLSRTKTMTMSHTWSIMPETGHEIEEEDHFGERDAVRDGPCQAGAKGFFDLRRLPPIVLRRPSQAANKRSSPQRLACGRRSKRTPPVKGYAIRENTGCPARPGEGSTMFESLLTVIAKLFDLAVRSFSFTSVGEGLPIVLDAEADGQARLQALMSLMKAGAQILLVLYVLASVFATLRWLFVISRPALWPLVMIFRVAKWIVHFVSLQDVNISAVTLDVSLAA